MPGSNVIQKTILDLHYTGRQEGMALQQEIGEWCRTVLVKAIGDQLDQLDVDDAVIRIDSLQIDVMVNEQEHWLDAILHEITQQFVQRTGDAVKLKVDLPRHLIQVFIHFLEFGSLPWWSGLKKQGELCDRMASLTMEKDEYHDILECVKQPVAKQRMAMLPDVLFCKFMVDGSPSRRRVWDELMKEHVTGADQVAQKQLTERIKMSILEHIHLEEQLQADEIRTTFKRLLTNATQDSIDTSHLLPDSKRSRAENLLTRRDVDQRERTGMPNDADPLYISDAGLVIIALFLPALFTKVGLFAEGKLVDVDKAVCLVHYLGTGEEEVSEADLGIAKILCGLMPDMVVDTSIVLDDLSKSEAENVLLSAIEHWSILKDTSVSGLRESFLRREGRLTFRNDTWELIVEQHVYDMLLQNLPWNISMIKLSWMPHLLKTEWVF